MGYQYKTFTLVDNRVCGRCGARAGNCNHIKPDVGTKQMAGPLGSDEWRGSWWEPDEKAMLARLWRDRTVPLREIAERLNKTEGAITGQAFRMGLNRGRDDAA